MRDKPVKGRKRKLVPPPGAVVYEGDLATYWFCESGILCGRSKPTPRTLELQRENFRLIRKISGGKKVCLLTDISDGAPLNKETRDYVAREMQETFRAMAFISSSPLGRMIGNIFGFPRHPDVPVRLFATVAEAREWLIEQMAKGKE